MPRLPSLTGQLAGESRDEAALRARRDACGAAPNGVAHFAEISHVRAGRSIVQLLSSQRGKQVYGFSY
jgi:hypothetical protein